MTGKELATLCEAQVGAGYVWGGLGYKLNDSRISQLKNLYPKVYTTAYISKIKAKWYGKPVFDCVGLIKYFLWGNVGDGNVWHYDAFTDYNANTQFSKCIQKGKIQDLPEMPGLMLHRDGHCGVYLGGGRAVEARGVDYGVVVTNVKDRDWTDWGKLPGIEYPKEEQKTISLSELSDLLKTNKVTYIKI